MANVSKFWFPAKRYGWGWGMPTVWQGWVVLGVYFASVVGVSLVLSPELHAGAFVFAVSILTVILVGICWIKGEPPSWRWGEK